MTYDVNRLVRKLHSIINANEDMNNNDMLLAVQIFAKQIKQEFD